MLIVWIEATGAARYALRPGGPDDNQKYQHKRASVVGESGLSFSKCL